MVIHITTTIIEGPVSITKEEKWFWQRHKRKLAYENLGEILVTGSMSTMRTLDSKESPGVLRLFRGVLAKRGIRNRELLGVLIFFLLLGLPRIRWLEW